MNYTGTYRGNESVEILSYSYKYGYQGSEKDDEVHGQKGTSYTTHFRQLDVRIGRWLSIDPEADKFPWQSSYVSMDNNPIWYNDQNGDSVLNNLDTKVGKDALKIFMKTKHGKNYIGKFAAKGQTIAGHTFAEDGEYHKDKFDLALSDLDLGAAGAQGTTEQYNIYGKETLGPAGKQSNGRTRINVNLNSLSGDDRKVLHGGKNLVAAEKLHGKGSWQLKRAQNIFLAGKIKVLTHELFIHANSAVLDYKDNGILDLSHQAGSEDHDFTAYRLGITTVFHNYSGSYKPKIIHISHANLYLYEGWYVIKSVHKWLGTKKDDAYIYKQFQNGL